MRRLCEQRIGRLEAALLSTGRLQPVFVTGDEDANRKIENLIRSGAACEGDEFFVFRTIYETASATGGRD